MPSRVLAATSRTAKSFKNLQMLFMWEDDCQKRTRTGKERQGIRRVDDFQVLDCVAEGPLEGEQRLLSDFLIWKMWLKIFSADSVFEILGRNGLGPVVMEGRDICGLWNFTILSRIIGLDLLFAHASLITLTLLTMSSQSLAQDFCVPFVLFCDLKTGP